VVGPARPNDLRLAGSKERIEDYKEGPDTPQDRQAPVEQASCQRHLRIGDFTLRIVARARTIGNPRSPGR